MALSKSGEGEGTQPQTRGTLSNFEFLESWPESV